MSRVAVTSLLILLVVAGGLHAGLNPAAKAAIHVLPHDTGRTCTKNFPVIAGCEDIATTFGDCADVDFFPVFFDLVEYQGIEYGIEWPGFETCAFTSCSDFTIGSIVNPGDGIAHTWTDCMTEPVAITGWGWLGAADYGTICLVPHPEAGAISVGDCSGHLDEPDPVFCAGLCGQMGDDPCPPGDFEPLDLSIDDGLGGDCVFRMDQDYPFTYTITYGNTANAYPVYNVVVTSFLPQGIVCATVSDGGVIDGSRRAIVWDIGTLDPGEVETVTANVWVFYDVELGANLINDCEIAGDGPEMTEAAETTLVCPPEAFTPLKILKDNDFQDSCQVTGGRVRHRIRCSNPPTNGYLGDTYVTDYLSPETIHVSHALGAEAYYDPVEHKVTWHFICMWRGSYDERWVVAELKPGLSPGAEVINRAEIVAEGLLTSEVYDTVRVCQDELAAFRLSLSVSPSTSCVSKGTNLTYTLSYTNINGAEVGGVSLVDHLPAETDFVSATGPGLYDAETRTVTWDLETVPADYNGSELLVTKLRGDAESWGVFSNYCEITGEGVGMTTKSVSTRACGAIGNGGAKVAVHLEPHASRACSKNFPTIVDCHDIVYEIDSTDVDVFPVFFDLYEYQGFEYGLTWPGSNTCAFTSCSNLCIGDITESGDGIAHAWYSCQPGPIGIPGWAWVEVETPGEICVAGHPWTYVISIGDCQDIPRLDQPEHTYCGGVAGGEGEDPCGYPVNVEPTTWGEIKAMFK